MDQAEEYRFQIDAYTPDTMPLSRLANYLEQLATLLGEEQSVHFVRLEAGSTVVVHRVDKEALPKVEERAASVCRGEGPAEAMRAYKMLNRLLREDNGSGILVRGTGAEIIRFLGDQDDRPRFTSVLQRGTLDGEVVRVGGTTESVPVTLLVDGVSVTGVRAKRSLVKLLARHLYETVRLHGMGRWARSEDGAWQVEQFSVDHFDVLDDRPLSAVVMELRALPGSEWGDDAVDELIALRHGGVSAE